MQTIMNSVPGDSLLAGAILDEYRDLLNSFKTSEPARTKKAEADTDDCDDNCDASPSCQQSPSSSARRIQQVPSWNDLLPA
jgi:hypothetical protein